MTVERAHDLFSHNVRAAQHWVGGRTFYEGQELDPTTGFACSVIAAAEHIAALEAELAALRKAAAARARELGLEP